MDTCGTHRADEEIARLISIGIDSRFGDKMNGSNGWKGQHKIADLLREGAEGIPKKQGICRVKILAERHVPKIHGSDRIILIGRTNNLSKRLGEFISAALGFDVFHAEGQTFWTEREQHKLSIYDLEIEYLETDDPICAEIAEFSSFEGKYRKLPMLCKRRPITRCPLHR